MFSLRQRDFSIVRSERSILKIASTQRTAVCLRVWTGTDCYHIWWT